MKRTPSFLRTQTLVALYLLVLEMSLLAQGTAFTYQGRLFDDGSPATGNYDLTFSLWNAASGPAQVGSTITNANTPVSNGLFAVTLDFGSTAFNGQARWLQIAAPAKGGGFTNLVPRQALTATPYAITAGNLTGALPTGKRTSARS